MLGSMVLISYAQNAEDVVLWRALGSVDGGFYIDVGAGDPVVDSVTKIFYDAGWSGVNVEPMPEPFALLQAARPRDVNLRCALEREEGVRTYFSVDGGNPLSTGDAEIAAAHRDAGAEVRELRVETSTLARVCADHAPEEIHFLKIDVEGREHDVLAGADFARFRPWIVLVEAVAPQRVEGLDAGAGRTGPVAETHTAWEPLLTGANYRFALFDGVNRFYVAAERWDDLGARVSVPANVLDRYVRAEDAPGLADPVAPAPRPGGAPVRGSVPAESGVVAVAGFFEQESGIGAMARALGSVLDESGADWTALVRRAGEGSARHGHPFVAPAPKGAPDLLIVCENADSLPVSLASGVFGDLADLPTVGYWAWEVEGIPDEYVVTAERLDEVWALSAFSASSIGAQLGRPVYAVPPVVTVPAHVDRVAARRALGLGTGFLVAFVYDVLSGTCRKNPLDAVDAYCRAFRPEDGCTFLVKTTNAAAHPGHLDELRDRADGRPDVVIRDGYLDADDHARVVHAADVYLSLHHAEGFGFTLAEAMAAGTPVIATGWSGNVEFMDATNSYPVRWEVAPVPPEASPLYPPGAVWVDPDVEHAAYLLRRAFADPRATARTGERARASISRAHTAAARAPLVAQRLRAIRERRARSADLLDSLIDALERPLDVAGPARVDVLARTWRTGVLRGLRHYDEQQRARLVAAVDAMRLLDERRRRDAADLERRVALLEARLAYQAQLAAAGRIAGGEA